MNIKIHKGTNEIGGSCIELNTKNTTILLDYGTPLQDESNQVKITDKIDAILISHPHQDHFGEIVKIDKNIPIYCGKLSLELMNTTKIFTGDEILTNNFNIFKPWSNFEIGDFKITPYLVDHSAVDSYSFLIEADNKKVFYSGDFRANGRKSKLYDNLLKNKSLKEVDIMLLEGTMIKRGNNDFIDEQSVENKIYQTITSNQNLSFIIGSSQNIDSIVSAYRACKKANKIFVIDIYTAWILEKLKIASNSIPNMSWSDVKVIKKFGGNYYEKLQSNKSYFGSFINDVFNHIVEADEIKSNPQNYLLKILPWYIEKLLNLLNLENANIIYSQWLGYMNNRYSDEKTVKLYKNLKEKYNFIYAHTSGHATLKDLQKFANALSPKKIIPIHTEYKKEFERYFDNVMILDDDESFDINYDKLSKYQVDKLNEIFKEDLE